MHTYAQEALCVQITTIKTMGYSIVAIKMVSQLFRNNFF